MAKKKTKENEVIGEQIISPKPKREVGKMFKLRVDFGSDPNGKPRYPKGSKIRLTPARETIFKNLKYI